MKLTISELKSLIREAVFADPVKFGLSKKTFANHSVKNIQITKLEFNPSSYEAANLDSLASLNLRVYFALDGDIPTWFSSDLNVDLKFLKELRTTLLTLGFSSSAVRSLHSGRRFMQETHKNYVVLRVGPKFIAEWRDLVGDVSITL